MRDEFIITRQGKEYALYGGLLDEAHAKGIRSIETELIETSRYKLEERGREITRRFAIVRAIVELEDGRRFSGLGDAGGPDDKAGKPGAEAPIRMAETRAKARALRDAINVSAGLLDDASTEGESDVESASSSSRSSSTGASSSSSTRGESATRDDEKRPSPESATNTKKGGAKGARKFAMSKRVRDDLAKVVKVWKNVETNRDVLAYLDTIAKAREKKLEDWTDDEGRECALWLQSKIDEDVDDESGLGETSRQESARKKSESESESSSDDDFELDEEDLEEIEEIAGTR